MKDLGSHKINSAVNPPEKFSPVPVLTDPHRTAEIFKSLPKTCQI